MVTTVQSVSIQTSTPGRVSQTPGLGRMMMDLAKEYPLITCGTSLIDAAFFTSFIGGSKSKKVLPPLLGIPGMLLLVWEIYVPILTGKKTKTQTRCE